MNTVAPATSKTFAAPRPSEGYKPAFTVQELEGSVTVRRVRRDPEVGFIWTEDQEPAGYLVTMARGHSIRVKDMAELKRLGFDGAIPIVNDEGDEVGRLPNPVTQSKK